MKKSGIVILSIGFVFTIFTTFNLLMNEHTTDPAKMKSAHLKVNYQVWEPMLGAIVLMVGVGVYIAGRKAKAARYAVVKSI